MSTCSSSQSPGGKTNAVLLLCAASFEVVTTVKQTSLRHIQATGKTQMRAKSTEPMPARIKKVLFLRAVDKVRCKCNALAFRAGTALRKQHTSTVSMHNLCISLHICVIVDASIQGKGRNWHSKHTLGGACPS